MMPTHFEWQWKDDIQQQQQWANYWKQTLKKNATKSVGKTHRFYVKHK